MKNNSFGTTLAAVLCVVGVLVLIGWIGDASTPKCIKSGCDNERASGSSYCYLHEPYSGSASKKSSSTSHIGSTSSQSSSSTHTTGDASTQNNNSVSHTDISSTQSSGSTSSKKSTGTKSSTSSRGYDSYDEGYEAVYDDDDYDLDRYYEDSDYADGVDDAMDDLDW